MLDKWDAPFALRLVPFRPCAPAFLRVVSAFRVRGRQAPSAWSDIVARFLAACLSGTLQCAQSRSRAGGGGRRTEEVLSPPLSSPLFGGASLLTKIGWRVACARCAFEGKKKPDLGLCEAKVRLSCLEGMKEAPFCSLFGAAARPKSSDGRAIFEPQPKNYLRKRNMPFAKPCFCLFKVRESPNVWGREKATPAHSGSVLESWEELETEASWQDKWVACCRATCRSTRRR